MGINPQSKILWVDTETTGVDPSLNAIVQIAGAVEIDGAIQEAFNILTAPFAGARIDADALKINGRTAEEIESFQPLHKTISDLKSVLGKYVSPYDRDDKFIVGGFRVEFDYEFIYKAFRRVGDMYGWGCWAFHAPIDVRTKLGEYIALSGYRPANCKLSTICQDLNIEIRAHDALSDILATRSLYYTLDKLIVDCRASRVP